MVPAQINCYLLLKRQDGKKFYYSFVTKANEMKRLAVCLMSTHSLQMAPGSPGSVCCLLCCPQPPSSAEDRNGTPVSCWYCSLAHEGGKIVSPSCIVYNSVTNRSHKVSGWDWKGPLGPSGLTPAKAGTHRAGYPGPRPGHCCTEPVSILFAPSLRVPVDIDEIPLSLLISILSSPSCLSLSLQERCFSPFLIFMALCWTLSCSVEPGTGHYSKCGLSSAENPLLHKEWTTPAH